MTYLEYKRNFIKKHDREEDIIMKKYVVEYTDPETGATSPIDNFAAEDGYTAEQYIKDCDSNADDEWCEMLHRGTVTLVESA